MNAYLALTKSRWAFGEGNVTLANVVKRGELKQTFYQQLIEEYKKDWEKGKYGWYKNRYNRYYADFDFDKGRAISFTAKSASPLVIGHGVDSVLETNLSLHPIYGIPYLPGTALKGLAAYYARNILGSKKTALSREGSDYDILFGTQQSAGFIQFHDALITPDTVGGALRQDVLTPHHQAYNASVACKEHPAPRDDDSPIPNPFLTAFGTFRIVLSCEGEAEQALSWLELAKIVLTKALADEGLGAKTNAGYGRLNAN